MKPKNIIDVAEGHLCTGCGACAYLEPETITMVDIVDKGLRPLVAEGATTRPETLAVCPGAGLTHTFDSGDPELVDDLSDTWGPVYAVYEGYAADPDIRWAGSSAGAATILAIHSLENEGMEGVVHIGADENVPYLNTTIFSTSRQDLLTATGSRYAPASPCTGLDRIEEAGAPCVFIGKPCDVAATQAARRIRPALDANLGLVIGIFCAGTPSTQGTIEMLRQMGIEDPSQLASVRYRGRGWPGLAEGVATDGTTGTLTYEQSWGHILEKHRQWRCYVCADHTGEFADVAVGDPWYRELDGTDPGRSLLVARTKRGLAAIEAAIESGLLIAWPVEPSLLPRSQPGLARSRGAVWARIQVLRLMRAFAPTYKNVPMFHLWRRQLPLRAKGQSTVGTVKRVFRKKLRERVPVVAPTESRPGKVDKGAV